MDSGNNKVFAFLLIIDDEILAISPPGFLHTGLEHCFVDCYLTYRLLFRVENTIRKYFLVGIFVCIILSKAGRKIIQVPEEVNLLLAEAYADYELLRLLNANFIAVIMFILKSNVRVHLSLCYFMLLLDFIVWILNVTLILIFRCS